jgi:hypothetical protein
MDCTRKERVNAMISPAEEFLRARSELVALEQDGPLNDLSELALRKGRREELERRVAALEREVRLLRQRVQRLPALPDVTCVRWAQSVLACPNGCILVVDTAAAAEEAGIVRLLLLDFCGAVCLDRIIAPGCLLAEQAMRDLGLTTRDLRDAPSLPRAWPSLLEALMGRYVVSYDLRRTRRALERVGEQYDLDPLPLLGDCLLLWCQRYFCTSGFTALTSLCELVGRPLPAPPDCTALDRARGQLHLLRCMSQGRSASAHSA